MFMHLFQTGNNLTFINKYFLHKYLISKSYSQSILIIKKTNNINYFSHYIITLMIF